MKMRCCNPSHRAWVYYGARGIAVCEEWLESFEAFLEDVGERPGEAYSLSRLDNNGDYESGNVKWQTATEQNRNKRPGQRRQTGPVNPGDWHWRGKWRDS